MARLSKLEKVKDIDYNKVIVINRLLSDDANILNKELKRLSTVYGDSIRSGLMNNAQIQKMAQNNLFSQTISKAIADSLRNNFTIHFDQGELDEVKKHLLETHGNELDEEKASNLSKFIIYDNLLWDFFQKEWNVSITDEEVDNILQDHYKNTNLSIREYKNDPEKFERMKNSLIYQKTINYAAHKFTVKLEKILTEKKD